MTGDITEVELTELLHLPPGRVQPDQLGPGRQGGPLLVVIGALVALAGLTLWGRAGDTLGWTVFALMGLGAALTATGFALAAYPPED